MSKYELTSLDKEFYAIAERLYTVDYHCETCNCDYHVKGAMPGRIYFCDDCKGELVRVG